MRSLLPNFEGADGRLVVGGQRLDGGGGFAVVDPARGEPFAEVRSASLEDGDRAVAAAADALPAWIATAPRQRSEVLRRTFDVMISRREELAALITLENGKPLADARAEVTYAAEFVRYYSEEAVRIGGELSTSPDGTMKIMVLRRPVGVALMVTPWNLPLAMVTRKLAPALAAGCTTVVKPAASTPLSALRFAELLAAAGAPDGVVNVLPTRDSRHLVDHLLAAEPVRKLSFTGSTEVGRLLLGKAAERVLSCSMELGGNAPLIVFDDADLDLTVAAALVAKMRHNGAACTAANRCYVHRTVAEEFTRRLGAAMAALRMGDGREPGTQLGPLIDEHARDGIAELVQCAIDDGAELVTGGAVPRRPGYFLEPTVLANVAPDAEILGQEIFGPVAPLVTFADDDDLIGMANQSEHGLMAYVFSRDVGRALRVAEALESGMVAINRGIISDPAAPFGGVKQSGVGREGGHDGLLEYTEPKFVGVAW